MARYRLDKAISCCPCPCPKADWVAGKATDNRRCRGESENGTGGARIFYFSVLALAALGSIKTKSRATGLIERTTGRGRGQGAALTDSACRGSFIGRGIETLLDFGGGGRHSTPVTWFLRDTQGHREQHFTSLHSERQRQTLQTKSSRNPNRTRIVRNLNRSNTLL